MVYLPETHTHRNEIKSGLDLHRILTRLLVSRVVLVKREYQRPIFLTLAPIAPLDSRDEQMSSLSNSRETLLLLTVYIMGT